MNTKNSKEPIVVTKLKFESLTWHESHDINEMFTTRMSHEIQL
jgi:hypothetical protein